MNRTKNSKFPLQVLGSKHTRRSRTKKTSGRPPWKGSPQEILRDFYVAATLLEEVAVERGRGGKGGDSLKVFSHRYFETGADVVVAVHDFPDLPYCVYGCSVRTPRQTARVMGGGRERQRQREKEGRARQHHDPAEHRAVQKKN